MYKASNSVLEEKTSLLVSNRGLSNYPHRLNFYDQPPSYDVKLEEFESSALDRLRVLAEIESSAARNRSWEDIKSVTDLQCRKYLPLNASSAKDKNRDEERRRDHLGHFVLRLAFCRSEDLRRRFVKAETTLFKVRFETDDYKEREAFLNSRDFHWVPVDVEEKLKHRREMMTCFLSTKNDERAFDNEKYFKVKWTRVPDLVEKRRVFLCGGLAYVPAREQSSIVYQEYEQHLQKALEMTARLLPRLDEDTRIVPILDNLSQGFLAGVSSEWSTSTTGDAGAIKAEMVDDLAKNHFPLCMRSLHDNLRRDSHLKHFGRLQYGLFLKVLGLSIEEAIAFWRKSFNKITDEKFNKEYKYNIRHSYGLEGKRANYPAHSCLQILSPGHPDCGCPYRQYNTENLQSALLSHFSSQGLSSSDLPEIMATVNARGYHVACTRVFEITHKVPKGEGIGDHESVTHPNQYAARSLELAKAKARDTETAAE